MSPHSGKQSRLAAEEILRFAQNDEWGTRLIGAILAVLLAVSMIPVAGLQSAFADEPIERPETTGGEMALEGTSDATIEPAAEPEPVAVQQEDGMLVADGLVYAVTDGGLVLVGFDGLPQGEDALKEIVVPETVSVDGKGTAVVSVAIAEDNVAESVVSLTLPQSINDVDTVTLAAAFPNLASVEVASPKASSAPAAAGAAAMKAAYSSFGGVLYKNVSVAAENDASQTTLTKELVWAPPATVVARIPAECTSIAPGAFADCADLKTVVCFGVMGEIPQARKAEDGAVTSGAFTDEQIATVNVIVPQTGTVVPDSDGERVSANVAVTDHSTMDIKREAWWKSGFASDRITLGEVYGSTTNTLPVTDEGILETAEAEVAYAPETTQNSSSRKAGIKPPESAIPTPVPDDDELDSSESGLAFTHLADMTLSVSWKGDPTATPRHIDIPAYATIDGVVYPVTEIAPHAFEGAVFLTSVAIPEGVTTIGEFAFASCANLSNVSFPPTLQAVAAAAFEGAQVDAVILGKVAAVGAVAFSVVADSVSQGRPESPESGTNTADGAADSSLGKSSDSFDFSSSATSMDSISAYAGNTCKSLLCVDISIEGLSTYISLGGTYVLSSRTNTATFYPWVEQSPQGWSVKVVVADTPVETFKSSYNAEKDYRLVSMDVTSIVGVPDGYALALPSGKQVAVDESIGGHELSWEGYRGTLNLRLVRVDVSITYDLNGHAGEAPDAQTADPGSTFELADLSGTTDSRDPRRTFAGWATQSDGGGTRYAGGATTGPLTANMTLYAIWEQTRSQITFKTGRGLASATATSSGGIVDSGRSTISPPVTVTPIGVVAYVDIGSSITWGSPVNDPGYHGLAWSDGVPDAGTDNSGQAYTVASADATLTAVGIPNSYTATFSLGDKGAGAAPAQGDCVFGTGLTLPGSDGFASSDSAYFFDGWKADSDYGTGKTEWKAGETFDGVVEHEGSVAFTAQWTMKRISVTVTVGEGASSQTVFWNGEGYAAGDGGASQGSVSFSNTGNYAARLAGLKVYDAGAAELFGVADGAAGPEVFSLSGGGATARFGFEGGGALDVDVPDGFEVPVGDRSATFTYGCDLSADDVDRSKVAADMGSSTYTAPLVKVVYVFEPAGL